MPDQPFNLVGKFQVGHCAEWVLLVQEDLAGGGNDVSITAASSVQAVYQAM